MINVIGDVGGQFDALISLYAKAPKADKTILVGDLNDRGTKSRQVIEWAIQEPNVITLHSNHGDMFVDYYRRWEAFLNNLPYRTRYSSRDFQKNI